MANSETIDQIISDKALAELDSATDKVALLAKQFNDLLPSVAALNAALGGNQSLAAFNRQLQQAALAQERVNKATAQAQVEQAKLQQIQQRTQQQADRFEQLRVQRENAEQRRRDNESRRNAAADTEYAKLIARQKELNAIAREQGATFGARSDQYRAAQADANAVNREVDAINRGLGNYSANVGNYLSKGFGFLRQAAAIIPGLGLSGIFLLIFEGLKLAVEQLGLFSKSTDTAAENLKNLNDVAKNANKEIASQSDTLKILYKAATDVNNSYVDRVNAAKELQKVFPQTFANIQTETILNGGAKDSYDQLTKSIYDNARARAAKAKIDELAAKQLDLDFKAQKVRNAQANELSNSRKDEASGAYDVEGGGILAGDNERKIRDRANKAQNDIKRQRASLQSQIDFLTNFAGGNNAIAKAITDADKQLFKAPKEKDDRKQSFDQLLQQAKATEDAVLQNENSSYADRYKAVDEYEKRTADLISSAEKAKIITVTDGETRLTKIATDNSNQRQKIQNDINKYVAEQYKKLYAELSDQEKQRLSDIQNAGNARLQELENQQTTAEAKLAEEYNKGKITYKRYQDGLKEIQEQASLQRIDVSIAEAQNSIETLAAGLALGVGDPKQLQDATNKLVQLQNQRKQQVIKIKTDETKTAEELAKQARDIEIQTAQEALSAVSNIYQSIVKAKQDQLKKEEDLIDKQAQRDKDANNRSLKSARQRAQAEAEIDAQAAAQKEVIRQKDLELRRKAAIEEKAAAIASIIINTQIGVAKVVGQTGIFGIPLSAFLYAQEALQIAAVLAQPLPAYEKGTSFAKGGLSRVSEKGSELVIEPSGKSYLTPETESIIDLKRGSKVIPAHRVQAMMGRPERIQNIGGVNVDFSRMEGKQDESNKWLKKIADKRTIIQQGNGKFMRYRNSYFGKN